jgi:hypothetical protein
VTPRKPKPGRSLAETAPEVAAMADGWDPASYSANSHARVKWKCAKGHSWAGVISTRAKVGPGCPICSNQLVVSGVNDMATTHPELAQQAHGWDPRTYVAGTNKRLEWVCSLGHTWTTQGKDRVQGKGCPYCAGNFVWVGFNDLVTTQPELAKEAHGWDPTTVSSRSGLKKEWLCSSGHVYESRVADRTAGRGCPFCQNDKVLVGYNDLPTTHPEVAAQAHGWDPRTVVAGSGDVLQWRCKHGHEWRARVSHRTNGIGCPVCSNKKVVQGVNDLATTHPELAAEVVGDAASRITFGSGAKIKWRCPEGHEYLSTPSARRRGEGCPYCSNHQALPGYNDLATADPALASQAYGWDPTTVLAGSRKRLAWRCGEGHVWRAVVGERRLGYGCPVCSGREVLVGYNDLASTHPELAAQANGWDATSLTARSGQRKSWKCELGHTWSVKINVRVAGKNCPYCSNTYVLPGFNDLATKRPDIAAEAHGWDPTKVSRATKQVREWKCSAGHIYAATVGARTRDPGGTGCPYCAGQKVIAGFNDFATLHPQLAAEADGWDPRTVPQWSVQMKNWVCPEGHKYRARIGNRSNGRGCPTCSKSGFDQGKPGYLYFLEHDDWEMLQIGITNVPEGRLKTHAWLGWTVREVRGPMEGFLTRQLESAALRALKNRGAVFANKAGVERFDGWSEAWLRDSLEVGSLKEILDFVYEDE